MALLLLELLRLQERPRIDGARSTLGESLVEPPVTGKEPRFEERRLDRNILLGEREAFVDRAHAVPDFEADIPQRSDELLELPLERRLRAARQQNEQIDIGIGKELAATVTANGEKREPARHAMVLPHVAQLAIDKGGQAPQ